MSVLYDFCLVSQVVGGQRLSDRSLTEVWLTGAGIRCLYCMISALLFRLSVGSAYQTGLWGWERSHLDVITKAVGGCTLLSIISR